MRLLFFSARARAIPLALFCAALLAASCATEGRRPPHAGLVHIWSDYLAMPDERALAIAGDPDRVWVGAASGGHASRREARESVLSRCRERRAARRLQDACRLYATGDEIVW